MPRPQGEQTHKNCKFCNNIFSTLPSSKKEFCSRACAQKFKGVDKQWMEKRKKTCLDRYGEEIAFKSKEVQEKYKSNLKSKYGEDNPFKIKEFKDKAKQSIINKYGFEIASQNDEVKNKISNTLKGRELPRNTFINTKWEKLLNYYEISGMEPLFDKNYLENTKLKHEFNNKFKFKCNKCSEVTEVFLSNGYLPTCKCSNYKGYSLIEDEILSFLSEVIEDDIALNRRDILPSRLELDFYIPSYNLAIEVNGVYWHSESMGKYRDYHLYKTQKCEEIGLQLIHILDYEWLFKKSILKSILLNRLGKIQNKIYARKCIIKEIKDVSLIRNFLDINHIQGYTHSSINLGLFYQDELYSLMTFSKNRFKKNSNEFELVRFCNKLNTNIIGAASKLFKYFENNYNKENLPIISFSDRRFFKGNLYKSLGFEFIKNTNPSYIYWKNNKILNRMSCQKHKLHKLLDKFDPNQTEYENMINNGWKRVWDSGNSKWIKK
jgi:hypothetical protein